MRLVALAAVWSTGVSLAVRYDTPVGALWLLVFASTLLLAMLLTARRTPLPALFALFLLLGMLRVEHFDGSALGLADYHNRSSVKVWGLVVSDPELLGTATRMRLRVQQIHIDDARINVGGDLLATVRPSNELASLRDSPFFKYGDQLLLEGALQAPPVFEDFDYPAYLASQGIDTIMSFPDATLVEEGKGLVFYRWLYEARRRLGRSIAEAVHEPQASVGQALLLGIRKGLPEQLVERFRVTGTSHVLAISGLHVGVLLGLALAASQRVLGRRRRLYLVAPLVLIWLYVLMAGMPPSGARAAIMGTVYLAALGLGRPRSVLPALAFAAAVMIGVSPRVLLSVSFQLSFAAMAGIAVIAEPIGLRLRRLLVIGAEEDTNRTAIQGFLVDSVAMTVAAMVATIPLIAFYFHRVSLIGLPATVLVLPALPFILVTQAVTGVVGLLSTTAALPLGWTAWGTTAYVTGVVDILSRLPGATVEMGGIAPVLVWGYYACLVLALMAGHFKGAGRWFQKRPVLRMRWSPIPRNAVPLRVLGPVVLVAALLWTAAASIPDGRLHVIVADVGQGDAIVVISPGGRHIVVDGGPEPMGAVRALGSRLPFWDRSIDLAVLTHPHRDHITGLTEVLRRYRVDHVLEREVKFDSPTYIEWRGVVSNEGAEVIQAQSGQVIAFDDGLRLQVLGPPERLLYGTPSDVNNASVVLRLEYGEVSFLLTGDMLFEAEQLLVGESALVDSDVLKVAHHGSLTSSSGTFLARVSPTAAVISVGAEDRLDLPHPEVASALTHLVSEDRLFLTSERGTVEFITDGRRLEVKTER